MLFRSIKPSKLFRGQFGESLIELAPEQLGRLDLHEDLVNLAVALAEAGVPIIGTPPDSIDRAEGRKRFQQFLQKLAEHYSNFGHAFAEADVKMARNEEDSSVDITYVMSLWTLSLFLVTSRPPLHPLPQVNGLARLRGERGF